MLIKSTNGTFQVEAPGQVLAVLSDSNFNHVTAMIWRFLQGIWVVCTLGATGAWEHCWYLPFGFLRT